MVPISSLTPSPFLDTNSTLLHEVYFRVIIPQNDGQFPPVVFPLYETPIQINQTNVGYVNIPADFSLSFDITPKGIISESGSIIHLTGNGKDNSRLPGIWFLPNSRNLYIRFSGFGYWDLGFTNVLLSTNATTQVQVNTVGLYIEVLLNGTVTQYMALPAARTTGPAVLHISDPWCPPANATISNVSLLPISISLQTPLIETPTVLSPRSLGKVNIPNDFSLSFNLNPKGIIAESGLAMGLTTLVFLQFGFCRIQTICIYVSPVLDSRIWGSPTFCFQQMQRPKYK
jgi:hypothetical protein